MAAPRQKKKVSRVMHEYKHRKLKSGSGRKVESRRQAVAIAMSESGQARRRKKSGSSQSRSRRSSRTIAFLASLEITTHAGLTARRAFFC